MVKTADSGSSYVPVEAFSERGFAKTSQPLRPADGVTTRQLHGAQLQHLAMNAFREELYRRNLSYAAVAEQLENMTEARLGNIMSGRTQIPLADLIMIARAYPHVGAIVKKYLDFILSPTLTADADFS